MKLPRSEKAAAAQNTDWHTERYWPVTPWDRKRRWLRSVASVEEKDMVGRLTTMVLAGIVAALFSLALGCESGAGPTVSPSSAPSPFVGFWTDLSDLGGTC